MLTRKAVSSLSFTGLVFCFAGQAHAHPLGGAGDFRQGLVHPFAGLDHFLAMIAVGLLAAKAKGKASVVLPIGFLGAMLAGGFLGRLGLGLPLVEPMILASVLVLGAILAARAAPPMGLRLALVGSIALFHGHAHATDMLAAGNFASQASGFMIGASALCLLGVVVGKALDRAWGERSLRWSGGAILTGGCLLLVSAL